MSTDYSTGKPLDNRYLFLLRGRVFFDFLEAVNQGETEETENLFRTEEAGEHDNHAGELEYKEYLNIIEEGHGGAPKCGEKRTDSDQDI